MCLDAQKRLANVEAPGSLAEVSAFVDETAPIVEDELGDLRELPRPSDDDQIDAYLAKLDETLTAARAVGAAASKGNEAEARARGQETERLTRQARALARRLGADKCSSQ